MTGLLAQHGLLLLFASVLLSQGGVPVPATPMLIAAGMLGAQGKLGFGPALAVTALATLPSSMARSGQECALDSARRSSRRRLAGILAERRHGNEPYCGREQRFSHGRSSVLMARRSSIAR